MSEFRRRLMMVNSGGALPYDAEVEYLQSTGSQFIQLGFGFDPTDEIVTNFSLDSSQGNDKYMVCPKTWNNSNNRFGMGRAAGSFGAAYGNVSTGNGNLYPYVANDGLIHEWQYSNKVFSIPELGSSKDYSSATFGNTTTDLKLFYGYNANTIGKINSYLHKKNGVAVCDLIAVRVGLVGYMYDRVNKVLYGNNGTGSFGVGRDLTGQMVEVEYVESLGYQYIQLDFGFDPTDEIYASFAITQTVDDKYIVCPRTWNNNNNRFGMGRANSSGFGVGYGNISTGDTKLSPNYVDTNIHDWQYKNYEFAITDIASRPSLNVQNITFGATTTELRLFYGYNSNTQSKLAYYKHIKNGVTVIELIPVRIGYKGFLYDRVSGTILRPSDGYFIPGADVN